MSRHLYAVCVSLVAPWLPVSALDLIYTSPPLSSVQHERVIASLDRRWEGLQTPSPRMGVRNLFSFAIVSAEADHRLDRIDLALALAEKMQDLDQDSVTYGNFRWYWGAERPEDRNAVEFSMQDGALLWMRHRDRLPDSARQRLARLITLSIEGIRRHRVNEAYTNIFLMKTWNCIALGEQTGRPKLAREGYAMLDAWLFYTWENGIHEYLSPTYYGTDLDSLVLIAAFSENEGARGQAEAALKLLWTDIAANWFEPCGRLGGAHSRDYDYLTGHGYLDRHLNYAGWLEMAPETIPPHFAALTQWRPPEALRELAVQRVPRMVRQRWGGSPGERSAQFVGRAVSLGTAGASYGGPTEKVLTVQFAGGAKMPVTNFLMDARNDPFGRSRELTGGGHMKALHLTPFLMSVQRQREALLLAGISPQDRRFQRHIPNPTCLLSHLVLPRDGVTVWIGDENLSVDIRSGPTETIPAVELEKQLRSAGVDASTLGQSRLKSTLRAAVPNRAFDVEHAPFVEAPFEVGREAAAGGTQFVWKPGDEGEVGPSGGRAIVPLRVPTAGEYYLLARVLAPTPSEDSFRIRIRNEGGELLPVSDWHIGVRKTWTWVTMQLSPAGPTPVELPAGTALLEILCREDGTKVDQILLADQRGTAKPMPLDKPLFVRHRDAAAGFRIVHAVDMQGAPAVAELRTDVAVPNAMTLTVTHSAVKPEAGRASIAIWTRVAEDLDDEGFAQFSKEFTEAQVDVALDGTSLEVTAHGVHGSLRLKGNLADSERIACEGDEPGAADALLTIDGEDLGRDILRDVDPIARYRRLLASASSADVAIPEQPFEAENAAFILPSFEKGEDGAAAGGAFIWQPGEPGARGGSRGGRILIPIRVSTPGPHYLWARVQAPTPDDDSFLIRIRQGSDDLLPLSDWHTGVHTEWEWAPMELGRGKQRAVDLPAGVVLLEIMCREDGTKMDQIWLTADAAKRP
ncbi:MAG: hypothetical protein HN742_10310 [Lentisphaerae bacterium]|jgi:hypothetical protein|nr:hypothetical protein [Lentisphaerota bacterium]MBT4818652.1 hypothetical protein [Lentisphaerota bacterium]MBT5611351.1 hypothetical protein [Lentisphaerota bacterium]MBT7060345.1 hypothetical protein [Lentisphaerota bacterium]MBT7842256.1 hypothetical protein [Lentisphaerota bacterium]